MGQHLCCRDPLRRIILQHGQDEVVGNGVAPADPTPRLADIHLALKVHAEGVGAMQKVMENLERQRQQCGPWCWPASG